MAEGIVTAGLLGIPLTDFWKMTPYQLRIISEAYHEKSIHEYNQQASLMYYNAIIPLSKKVPPLSDFLYEKNKKKAIIDEDAIKGRFQAYIKQREKTNGKSGI